MWPYCTSSYAQLLPPTHIKKQQQNYQTSTPAFLKPLFHTNSMSHYLLPCYNGVINLQYYVTYRNQQHKSQISAGRRCGITMTALL